MRAPTRKSHALVIPPFGTELLPAAGHGQYWAWYDATIVPKNQESIKTPRTSEKAPSFCTSLEIPQITSIAGKIEKATTMNRFRRLL
jgi:hypothetical protein